MSSAPDPVRPGSILDGRYELISMLGSGGFGLVYKARQLTTQQLVAIKVARHGDGPGEHGAVARFRREMEVVAELGHPNIVRLIDSGQLPDGRLFAVLQLVRGLSLADLLKQEGPLDPDEAKRLMMQVLDALCSAHDLGVIHRDLKPANIMVTSVGALRNAMVLDFGIATFTKAMRDESYQSLTPDGSVGGTPSYMAPEQLHGREPNPQTDIYAWGLVFLECLTGQRVVRGATIAENMFIHLRPDPHPLPAVVSAHPLGRVMRGALAKDPGQRFANARDVLVQLAPCIVADLPKLPRPEPAPGDAGGTDMLPTADPYGQTGLSMPLNTKGHTMPWASPLHTTPALDGNRRPGRPPDVTPSSSQIVVAERRQLTAMACEIGPLGTLSEILSPDELFHLLNHFRRICRSVIADLDGAVERSDGGRILSYFGYPVAHEDDPSRAVQAALEIHRAIRAADFELPQSTPPVEVRIGIHTGIVVTSSATLNNRSEEISIVGDASRIALSLQEHAAPGTVLISDAAHRLVRDRFECEPAGARQMGSQGASVPVHRVLGTAGASHLPSMSSDTPAIGRESELGALQDRWEEVCDGRGQVVLITGEAGIGKSHLLGVFRQHIAGTPHMWLDCVSSPYQSASAFHPVIYALSSLFQFQRDDDAAARRRRIKSSLASMGMALPRMIEEFLCVLLEIDEPAPGAAAPKARGVFRQPAEEQLLDFFFALADHCPLVILLEDLQWADPSTLEMVQILIDQTPLGSVLTLATTRPVYVPDWQSRSHVTRMPLSRLSRKRVETMVRAVAGGKQLPDELVAHLARKTDGVPLFVEELTKAVLESSAVIERDTHFELASDLGSQAIPVSLRGSLMARLDRLGPAKEVTQIASVIGREFSFSLLEAICELPSHELSRAIDQLVQAELAIQRGRPPNARYVFKHALVQDTAYESLLERTRRRYHARIADALEQQFPDVVQSQPELLAHHYTEARSDEKAISYWLRAGRRASERSANLEGIQQLRKGLEILARQPESEERDKRELNLIMSLGAPLMAIRGYGAMEVEQNFSRALTLCRKLGDTHDLVPSIWGLWVFYQVRGKYENALEMGEQLHRLAERMNDPALYLCAHQALGSTLLLVGEYDRARAHFEAGLAIYDPDKHRQMTFIYAQDPSVFCHVFLARVSFAQGFAEQAWEHAHASIDIGRRLDHPHSLAFGLCMSLFVFQARGDLELIEELALEAVQMCVEHRLPHWLALAQFMGGVAHAGLRDLHAGIAQMRHALDAWRAAGAGTILPYFHSLLAEHLGRAGMIDEGIAVQSQVPANNSDNRERYYESLWKRTHSELLMLRNGPGDMDRAHALLEEALDGANSRGDRMEEIRSLTALVMLGRKRGMSVDAHLARLRSCVSAIHEGPDLPMMQEARRVLET